MPGFINRFSTPMRGAIIGYFGGVIGMFLSELIFAEPAGSWLLTPIATGVGGWIGGKIYERRKQS